MTAMSLSLSSPISALALEETPMDHVEIVQTEQEEDIQQDITTPSEEIPIETPPQESTPEEAPQEMPTAPQEEQTVAESDFVIDSRGYLTSYKGTDAEVVIPDNVVRVSRRAFDSNTTITKVTVPASCTYIDNMAFYNCTSLEEVVLNSKTVTFSTSTTCVFGSGQVKVNGFPYSEVPTYCEKFTNLTFVALPQDESEKFQISSSNILERYWGKEEIVTIPSGVVEISTKAFENCSTIKKIIFPESMTVVDLYGLQKCSSLEEIELMSKATQLKRYLLSSQNVKVLGFSFSQAQSFCEGKDNMSFVAKDDITGGIKEHEATPEKFTDGQEVKQLYKITVKDIIHGYTTDKVIERNITPTNREIAVSPLIVNGSHFRFEANDKIIATSGHKLVTDSVVEGTVNGKDIVVEFHYSYDGNESRYQETKLNNASQELIYCAIDSKIPVGDEPFKLKYKTSSPTTSDITDARYATQYQYDAQGVLTNESSFSSTEYNLSLTEGYQKLEAVSGTTTKYQKVPSVFGKAGIREYLILDSSYEGGIEDSFNNQYRVGYNVDANVKEETFRIYRSNSEVGAVKIMLQQTDGYLSTLTPQVSVVKEGIANTWNVSVEPSRTENFVVNPVTGEVIPNKAGGLLTLKFEKGNKWEPIIEDLRNMGNTSVDAGFYIKEDGNLVFLPQRIAVTNRRFPNQSRLNELLNVTDGEAFAVDGFVNEIQEAGIAKVIGIKNQENVCVYDNATDSWLGGHIPTTGEICKTSDGRVFICEYPVTTAPDTWGYIEVTGEILTQFNNIKKGGVAIYEILRKNC